MFDLPCVIHVHSTFSDGTATVPEIIQAASSAGAAVVVLTDHDSREAARHGLEGWHDGVLLLVGHEITTRRGHLLALGLEDEVEHRGLSEMEICAEVHARGGFGFAAHPFSRGGVVPSIIRPHPWNTIEQCESLGIEVWSLLTDVAERWRSPTAAIRFLRGPEAWLSGPPPESLAEWDRLCQRRRVPGIGGLDAHQTGIRIRGRVLSPMPHARYFKLLRTHVLLERPPLQQLAADRAAVYDALREGRCYLALDSFAPAQGFDFFASGAEGQRAPMGTELTTGRWTLRATAPRPAEMRLLCDGRPTAAVHGQELEHEVAEPGVYRLEAWLGSPGAERPWIFSNPIYIR